MFNCTNYSTEIRSAVSVLFIICEPSTHIYIIGSAVIPIGVVFNM